MHNRTKLALGALFFAIATAASRAPGLAVTPSPAIVTLDADERAEGNRVDIARRIGEVVFATRWPAQVMKIAADGIGGHTIVELRISGVKFHTPLTRSAFLAEIATMIQQGLAAAPIDEVDVAVEIPIGAGKGVVVSGDLAKPTSRTVFTISVRRGERPEAVLARLRSGTDVYWDEDWAKSVLKVGG